MATGNLSTRKRHCAVKLDNCVVIFGGVSRIDRPLPTRAISKYNLYTEAWSKYVIPQERDAPEPFTHAVAVNIDGTIYTFGGCDTSIREYERNPLWTLKRTKKGCFTWNYIKPQCKEQSPSPRNRHTGWEYEGKLWIFGGFGPSIEGYLKYSGYMENSLRFGRNNQLLCYDPNSQKWTNPQCFGDVPSPRSSHANALVKNKL